MAAASSRRFFISGAENLDTLLTTMPRSFLGQLATVRQGAYLPHWSVTDATYHVVFRLADALPAAVVERYRRERAALIAAAANPDDPILRERLREHFSAQIERQLDAGGGACWLAQPGIADEIAAALEHFAGKRYRLHAWCVMPNHVHAVVQPLAGPSLTEILHSWKSFTSTKANCLLGRTGRFWQQESYDHIVRDAEELGRTIRYVQENPGQAELSDWKWVWPARASAAGG